MKALLLLFMALAGPPEKEDAILLLSGAASMEELSESELERYEALSTNPIRINIAPRSRLLSCGLFSKYQVASLLEYIGRTGDILSFTELAAVNGFGQERTQALRYFVSLESHSPPGSTRRKRVRQEALARASFKEENSAYAAKYHMEVGENADLYLSVRNSYTEKTPSLNAASLAIYSRAGWKAVLGDFNARFGQGLICWSGLSLSGFSSVSAFRRNGNGFSPTGSFSPAHRGAAFDWSRRRWTVGAAGTVDGIAMAAVSYCGNRSNYGLQAVRMRDSSSACSFDWRMGFGHFVFHGEAAAGIAPEGLVTPAVLAGLGWAPAYKVQAELLARYYPPEYQAKLAGAARSGSKVRDEAGVSAGLRWKDFSFSTDAALHPKRLEEKKKNSQSLKTLVCFSPSWQAGHIVISTILRWAERCYRSPDEDEWRNDLRADISMGLGGWSCSARLNAVQVGDSHPGFLSYLEGGYKSPSDSSRVQFSAVLRACSFSIPDWNSRIYVYERSLPGCFAVPAYYGRGRAFSFSAGYKLQSARLVHRFEAAATCVRSDKSTKTEFKLQYRIQKKM